MTATQWIIWGLSLSSICISIFAIAMSIRTLTKTILEENQWRKLLYK